MFGSTLLSEVYAVIPECNVTADIVNLDDMEFSSNVRVVHSHEGVGSGKSILYLTLYLKYKASLWITIYIVLKAFNQNIEHYYS